MEYTTETHDLLGDEIHPLFRFTQASRGERLANYVIDNLLMSYGLGYLTGMAIGWAGAFIAPEFMNSFIYEKDPLNILLLSYIISILNYIIYYTLCEKFFKGKTLGKLITKTRAVRDDGEELTFKDALLRSLSRLVPFEVFSGFGDPWHDAWTKTMVVKNA